MRTSPALVLAFLIAPAPAEVIYSGLWNIPIPLNFDGIYLDIDTGTTGSTEIPGWDINIFFGGVGIAASAAFQPGRSGTGNEDPIQRVSGGFLIGAPDTVQAAVPAESRAAVTAVTESSGGESSGDGSLPDETYLSFLTPDRKSGKNSGSLLSFDDSSASGEASVTLVTLQYSSGPTGSFTHLGAEGNFQDGEEGYFGFRFMANDGSGPYYGWMRVTLTANTAGAIIHDWAWETSGGGISAGQIPEPGPAIPLTGLAAAALLRRHRPYGNRAIMALTA